MNVSGTWSCLDVTRLGTNGAQAGADLADRDRGRFQGLAWHQGDTRPLVMDYARASCQATLSLPRPGTETDGTVDDVLFRVAGRTIDESLN